MAQQDPIWSCAQTDLVIDDDQGQGHHDVLVWEHSRRVCEVADWLTRQADVPKDRVEQDVLLAACLYHDAGWIIQVREGIISRAQMLCGAANEVQRELAATLMEKRLVKLLPAGLLRRAADCVRYHPRRDCEVPEARILYDADNLDHVGPLQLWEIVRRQGLDGKGIEAAIDTWKRKKEYGYFNTRINAFRFESARVRARERLKETDHFLAELARQHRGEDLVT
ncbi:MAG TPA: HD domain-containing protein [Phycisphaerae bacterium]|nr:HD domain-containing protein [Phycisphaerae bacterium]